MSAVIPVIDLLEGRVVRGIAGRRSEYHPIVSPWSESADPLEIVYGLREAWGFAEFYVADLDAIQFNRPQWPVYESLIASGARLLLDAGVRDVRSAQKLIDTGVERVVVALETLDDPELLTEVVQTLGAERVVFSLDLMQDGPMARGDWHDLNPFQIAARVVETGVNAMIVLDLAGVGVGAGIPTLPLCCEIHRHWPHVLLITGGGVRDADDIVAALQHGVQSVLVASALHNLRLTKKSLERSLALSGSNP